MQIERASLDDQFDLTAVMRQSKAYWGYSSEQLKLWENDLMIGPEEFENQVIYKASIDDQTLGFYSYLILDKDTAKLDNLFILPTYIGKGLGKFLLHDFLQRLKEEGLKRVTLDSDPHAEDFYLHFGFVTIGQKETSIKNRFMPIMELQL